MNAATLTVFCPVCERQVPISETPAPLHDGEANLQDDPGMVCLGFGHQCTGTRCPVSGLPTAVMGIQLARSGIPPVQDWRTITMRCDGCDRITVMEIVDDVYASCTECRTTNRRSPS